MFGLFKKKSAEKKQEDIAQSPELKEFAAQFLPEELTVLAVTGANGFGGGKLRGETLWTASIGLTAWMEEGTDDIHRGEFSLTTLCDDKLLEFLRRRAPRDFILRCRVRRSEDGRRLLLLDLPEPGFDPDLKAILTEQKKPVTFQDEDLGEFTLNRQVNWFETELDWLGTSVSLSIDVEEERDQALRTAKALLAAAPEWDSRIRECAAGELLEAANDWAADSGDGDEEPEPLTREQFMQRMELESIQVTGDGGWEFWFADGDMFYGHSIHVWGDLENGPKQADMEG